VAQEHMRTNLRGVLAPTGAIIFRKAYYSNVIWRRLDGQSENKL